MTGIDIHKIWNKILHSKKADTYCFLCGVELTSSNKSIEHLIPKWLQRKYDLWNQHIVLLNGTSIPYKNLTIPCCKDCNNHYLKHIESKVHYMNYYYEFRDIAAKGDDTFLKYLDIYKVDAQKEYAEWAMLWACRFGQLKSVRELIKRNIDCHFEEEICLKWASQNGHLDIVKLLVEEGADIHAKQDYALSTACREGHFSIVKLLIENGADVNTWDNQPLLWASQRGHKEIALLLIENGARPTQGEILRQLCYHEDLDSLKKIIDDGFSLDEIKELLYNQPGRPYISVIDFLISKGIIE